MASKNSKTVAPNIDVDTTPTEIQIAWIAGIFEGEGHAWGHQQGRTAIVISQKDPEILYRCREMFGGRIEMLRASSPKYIHAWKLYGDRARRFFQLIFPLMSTRRKMQIEKAGGLKIVGKLQPTRDAMTEERKQLRADMTQEEKARESYRSHRSRHYDRVTAYQREYMNRKRALKFQGSETSQTIQ